MGALAYRLVRPGELLSTERTDENLSASNKLK